MKTFFCIAAVIASLSAHSPARPTSEVISGIVPAPLDVMEGTGSFNVKGTAVRYDRSLDLKTQEAIVKFADCLGDVCGKKCRHTAAARVRSTKGIVFSCDPGLGAEAYRIGISEKSVLVDASSRAGFLYAMQTLKQMLPVAVYGKNPAPDEDWTLPCCTITDSPRYRHRGMLLDCGRHFFCVNDICRYLDIMAIYKMNRFHWHLTEDQGWRIEIRKYPKLTEVGAWRSGTQIGKDRSSSDGVPYGGFYTQDQIREVIAYADRLGIEIVPEIDIPGHMLSALASYPELGFEKSRPYKVWTRWGVCHNVLNVSKKETMQFITDVIGEVADLFPGEYFCIGGDECPKEEWREDPGCQAMIRELGLVSDEKASAEDRLQNHVMLRVQKMLAAKGKKVMGADEMMEGDLEGEDIVIMSWRGTKRGQAAASKGMDVLMIPTTHCFLDYYQLEDVDSQPLAIGNYLPMSKVYSFNPSAGMDAEAASHIIGVQAQMWTEYVATPEHIEYMLFPRLFAMSEVQWCSPGRKDYSRFTKSVDCHQTAVIEMMGCNHCDRYE